MQFTVEIRSPSGSHTVTAEEGRSLLSVLREADHPIASPCGGRGTCGKCRVICSGALSHVTEEERKKLTAEDLSSGWRLACAAKILGPVTVQLDAAAAPDICADFEEVSLSGTPMFRKFGAAVDIGTTTVALRLYGESGFLATSAAPNPQSGFGADVISRVGAQLAGHGEELKSEICRCVKTLLEEACRRASVKPELVDAVVITGNTAMLCLLTGTSTETLSHMPFAIPDRFGREIDPASIGLTAERVYLPPCIGPFVGADITCSALSCGLLDAADTVLMADIGTNGEIVLAHEGVLTACSTAAGPALEGAGISCGRMAIPGAVDSVRYENGGIRISTIGGAMPEGICGSGVIDAVAAFLDAGALDEYGLLDDESDVLPYLEDEQALSLCESVFVSQKDIRMVQLAKSAICAGMRTLLTRRKCPEEAVKTLFVAGGFGKHIRFESAAKIGLIPPKLEHTATAVGNAALAGASMLLRDESQHAAAEALASRTQVLELNADPAFMDLYTNGMMFGEDD